MKIRSSSLFWIDVVGAFTLSLASLYCNRTMFGCHPIFSATVFRRSSREMEDSIVNGLLLPSGFFTAEGILNTGEKVESCHWCNVDAVTHHMLSNRYPMYLIPHPNHLAWFFFYSMAFAEPTSSLEAVFVLERVSIEQFQPYPSQSCHCYPNCCWICPPHHQLLMKWWLWLSDTGGNPCFLEMMCHFQVDLHRIHWLHPKSQLSSSRMFYHLRWLVQTSNYLCQLDCADVAQWWTQNPNLFRNSCVSCQQHNSEDLPGWQPDPTLSPR